MPDFDKLHDAARLLESLTRPGQREEGLFSWSEMVDETWKEIVALWVEQRMRTPPGKKKLH